MIQPQFPAISSTTSPFFLTRLICPPAWDELQINNYITINGSLEVQGQLDILGSLLVTGPIDFKGPHPQVSLLEVFLLPLLLFLLLTVLLPLVILLYS